MFPDMLRVSSFPGRFPHYSMDSGIVSPLRFRWIKSVCVFRCNLPPALLAEYPGSFTCHCGSTGMERSPNKSQHTKLTMEKTVLPPLLPGLELANFRSRLRRSYQQALPAHIIVSVHQTALVFHREKNMKKGKVSNNKHRTKTIFKIKKIK